MLVDQKLHEVMFFSIITIVDKDNAPSYYASGKLWVSTNFTWLYIRTCCSPAPHTHNSLRGLMHVISS